MDDIYCILKAQDKDTTQGVETMAKWLEENEVDVKVQCRCCSKVVEIATFTDDLQDWQEGELIQDAIPYLLADEREILISRICGSCFEAMFSEE